MPLKKTRFSKNKRSKNRHSRSKKKYRRKSKRKVGGSFHTIRDLDYFKTNASEIRSKASSIVQGTAPCDPKSPFQGCTLTSNNGIEETQFGVCLHNFGGVQIGPQKRTISQSDTSGLCYYLNPGQRCTDNGQCRPGSTCTRSEKNLEGTCIQNTA